jgi:serine/threonine protein kinase
MSLLVNTLIGEYRLTEPLGAGGMGEVYKAVHVHLGRVIAIKVLSSSMMDGHALQRFYNEANIQAGLKHPSVAEYLGFYEYQERPCILMEYVDGETLSTLIQKQGALPAARATEIMREIAAAIAHFHAQGVVHRDLKTSNIKMATSGYVKILDFGIARHERSDRLTQLGAVVGTTEALAPEQVRGEPASFATDVWQLGVLFYELLTGHLPFQAVTIHETYNRILSAEYPPLRQWRPDLPDAIVKIVSRCLQKAPARRYPSARELHQALCSCEKPAAKRWPAGLHSFRPAWAWGGIGVLLVAAAITIGVWKWNREGSGDLSSREIVVHEDEGLSGNPSRAEPAVKIITVDTMNGSAQVVREEMPVGATPFQIKAHMGDRINLILRREGYKDLPVQFEVSERQVYTYILKPGKDR